MVVLPDLLPPEDVPARSRSPSTPTSAAARNTKADAVWGAADAVRAVVVPQDPSASVHGFATLDLAVAAASMAAAAAEEAADVGELDRYPPIEPSASAAFAALAAAAGGGAPVEDEGRDGKGDGEDAAAAARRKVYGSPRGVLGLGTGARVDRPSLIVEAVAALLQCGREEVTGVGMVSHGLDLFYKQEAAASPSKVSKAGGGGGGKGGGSEGSGSPVNERASELAGTRVVGDAVVVLVDGGMEHGAAGSGELDGDGKRGRWSVVRY